MSPKAFMRCLLISIVLAIPLPWLMSVVLSVIDPETTQAAVDALLGHYVELSIAAFVLFMIATLAVQWFSPRLTSIADIENDDRESGTVKWFNVNKGYGFITRDNGESEDVFVHFRAIRGKGHRTLVEGQRVRYHAIRNERGLQAEDVTVIT